MKPLKIVDYKLLEGYPASLELLVQHNLREGWRPWGAPFSIGSSSVQITQAMVKYETVTTEVEE